MLRPEQLFILHHVFLPPKPPQSSDDDDQAHALLPRILKGAENFAKNVSKKHQHTWEKVARNIRTWTRVYSDGAPCESGIEETIKSMQDGDILLLYVKCQNAAILLRRTSTSTIFETFEVQPQTEPVLAAQDAILRTFPAKSVSVPTDKMQDSAFVHQLALYIHKLSTEHVAFSMEKSTKGNKVVVEERQSAHPMLVTDWLMTILATVGEPDSSALIIDKRTHDEVCFENALKPWRRSPVWLSVRVALQITARHLFSETDNWNYKNFMLFLMTQLATEIVATRDANLDDLHVLRVKIARRHAKLDQNTYGFVGDLALKCLDRIKGDMNRQWRKVIAIENTIVPRIEVRSPKHNFILDKSFAGLQQLWNRSHALTGSSHSEPPLTKSKRHNHRKLTIPDFSDINYPDSDGLFSLLAIEKWVEDGLRPWMSLKIAVAHDCNKIMRLMVSYHAAARAFYESLPERLSIMLLTIAELLIALDQLAVSFEPLIKEYSLEVSVGAFDPLLLPKKEQVKRLGDVEAYLTIRQTACNATTTSLLSGRINANSFAVRYFDTSSELQDLKADIESRAHNSRDAHQTHFDVLRERQRQLKETAALLECDIYVFKSWHERAGQEKHDFKCRKCAMNRDAMAISIAKHEWPLPSDIHMAKAAVFEMKPSLVFVWWREAILLLHNDIALVSTAKSSRAKVYLQVADASVGRVSSMDRRVVLASSVKPLSETHYKIQELDHDSIFVDHCMRYNYYDTKIEGWLRDQNGARSFNRYCRTKIAPSTPAVLHSAVNETNRCQNKVIAEQDKCPPEFSTSEFVSICSLRAGGNIQWMNLLVDLRTGHVNFNNAIVGAIVEQVAHQVGPCTVRRAEKDIRDTHVDLSTDSFYVALTTAINTRLKAIEGNWQETETAAALLTIVHRLLSFNKSPSQEIEMLQTIRKLRITVLQWLRRMREITDEMQDAGSSHGSHDSLNQRMFTAALMVRASWNIEGAHLAELFKLPDDLKDFIECSVHMYNLSSGIGETGWPEEVRQRLRRDRILVAKLESILTSMVKQQGEDISKGIQRFVPSLKLSHHWRAVATTDGYWFVNTESDSRAHVRINILSGKLTIGGRPLRHLPDIYQADSTYKTIFGDRAIDVMISNDPVMDYQVTRCFDGHTVNLATKGSEVLIRSESNGRTYQAVPRHIFQNDIPPLLIRDTVAWMDLGNGHIVFRKEMWKQCPEDLVLVFDNTSPLSSSLQQGTDTYYISCTSLTGSLISQVLMHFEKTMYLHMSYDEVNESAEVKLPRYGLSFKIDEQGTLYCHELSSVVSQSQSIGALHGLQNRLVLESVCHLANYSKRTVLIPYGTVSILRQAPHVNVCVDTKDKLVVQYFRYQIDERLGQLISNNDLEAHFFKAYLHAVTSSPLADSLTSRTGTGESLQNLSDRFTRTTIPLTDQARNVLGMIARLTPGISFYPQHLQTMQQTHWHEELPSLSQHGLFFVTVEEIITYNQRSLALSDGTKVSLSKYTGDIVLLHRYLSRSMKYYAAEAVVFDQRKIRDVVYDSRDRQTHRASQQAYRIASQVDSWPMQPPVQKMLHEFVAFSKRNSGFHGTFFAIKLVELLDMNISKSWPSLLNLCLKSSRQQQERLRFEFSMIAFGKPAITPYLTTLLAFATCDRLRVLAAPSEDSYDLTLGQNLEWKAIGSILEKCQLDFEPYVLHDVRFEAENRQKNLSVKKLRDINIAARRRHESEVQGQREQIEAIIKSYWPAEELVLPMDSSVRRFDISSIEESLNPLLKQWYTNYHFQRCIKSYDLALQTLKGKIGYLVAPLLDVRWVPKLQRGFGFDRPSLLLLMRRKPEVVLPVIALMDALRDQGLDSTLISLSLRKAQIAKSERDIQKACDERVQSIIGTLHRSASKEHQSYSVSLSLSLSAVRRRMGEGAEGKFPAPSRHQLDEDHSQSTTRLKSIAWMIRILLQPDTKGLLGLQLAGLWPEVTHLGLLRLLCLGSRNRLPSLWRRALLCFAQAVTALQRVERIKKYIDIGDDFALHKELDNQAHNAWSVADHPDWLLLEVQNDMLIRPIQIKVACEIMRDENASLMLGMGEGKTSVILPMVITEIANGSKLLRVIVLKSLVNEMLRTLSHSLAGLVDRPVYYLPFSRKTRISEGSIEVLSAMYRNCMSSHGVLLALPEHLNSFRLIGIDRLSVPNDRETAEQLLKMQKWLDKNTREVMDECDEILKPAYELVYTNGEAKLLRGAPGRWCVVLDLLSLLRAHLSQLRKNIPESIELEYRGHSVYPRVRILKADCFDYLANRLIDDVVCGRLPGIPPCHLHQDTADALRDFVLELRPSPVAVSSVTEYFTDAATLDRIYLVRGLVAYGILRSALLKRWHVNYGLDRGRCMSAVPYRAKSTPSPAAEFAQPEMMVLLTTLSFYYSGLTLEDIRWCLIRLHKLPDPADEYAEWVAESLLPPDLHDFASINVEDASCVERIHQYLSSNTALVNFFLNHFVFPREAKEFPKKLSTSAWDLCSEITTKTTSGFSGTGDSLLPLSIPQRDVPDLKHTAASILCTLIRPENQRYVCFSDCGGRRSKAAELLDVIAQQKEKPSVIIDVGAQFLEANQHIAAQLLCSRPDKKAVVYFDTKDQKMVVYRNGRIGTWESSPFRDQTNDCAFYLDEFHTRGTDFQFPDHYCGAVLLGPNLQKDTCVQACMRMRKLGFTQSVIFFAPSEIDVSIRTAVNAAINDSLTSYDVLLWTIYNSCTASRNQRALWLLRGLAHAQRKHAFSEHVKDSGKVARVHQYLGKLQEVESRPLSEMYKLPENRMELPYRFSTSDQCDEITSTLLQEFHGIDTEAVFDHDCEQEQEREILHEAESEREVQRPASVSPFNATVDEQLYAAICGTIHAASLINQQSCFELLKQTSLQDELLSHELPDHVKATKGFLNTIVPSDKAVIDDYLRPVQWVLQIRGKRDIYLISPHEADVFLPLLRDSRTASLSLYSARTSKAMESFDRLDVYRVPETIFEQHIDELALATLRLFAGQLYFNNVDEYKSFCHILGLWDGRRTLEAAGKFVGADLFVAPRYRTMSGWYCGFRKSPVDRIRRWINMRRHGIEWGHTHVGRVLNGQVLTDKDFN